VDFGPGYAGFYHSHEVVRLLGLAELQVNTGGVALATASMVGDRRWNWDAKAEQRQSDRRCYSIKAFN